MGVVAGVVLITAVITAVGIFCKQKKKKSTEQPEPIELKEKGQ